MSVTQANPAVAVMEAALASGVLAPAYEDYVGKSLRGNSESWYGRTLAAQGKVAAEAELASWNRKERMSSFADGLESVVRGVLSVARVDHQCKLVKLLDAEQSESFAFWPSRHADSRIVVFLNDEVSTRVTDRNACEYWSREGSFQLRAVFLLLGSKGGQAGLCFPQRGHSQVADNGLCVLEWGPMGRARGRTSTPIPMHPRTFLHMQAGLLSPVDAMRIMEGGNTVDSALGYPGALQTVAEALPGLEICLCELAADLQRRGWSSAV